MLKAKEQITIAITMSGFFSMSNWDSTSSGRSSEIKAGSESNQIMDRTIFTIFTRKKEVAWQEPRLPASGIEPGTPG